MKRTVCLCLIFCCLLGCVLTSCEGNAHRPTDAAPRVLTYLVVGLDEAAGNTDVMMLLFADVQRGELTALQLPRDTYVRTGCAQNKLNQVFAHAKAAGKTPNEALSALRAVVERALGVRVDAALGVGFRAFSKTVDAVGGVRVTLPEPISLDTGDAGEEPVTLPAGEHLLDGAMAQRFVRHRQTYAAGDLGRMDAQKIFLSALARTVRQSLGVTELLSLATTLQGDYISDTPLVSLALTAANHYPTLRTATLRLVTLPGEAVCTASGLSYYAANKAATAKLLTRIDPTHTADVDPDGLLLRAGDVAFENIYYDKGFSYRIYGEEDIEHMHIPRSAS